MPCMWEYVQHGEPKETLKNHSNSYNWPECKYSSLRKDILERHSKTRKAMISWILSWKVQDLKHLLAHDMNTEEGMAIFQEWKNLILYQSALYHHHTSAGKLEECVWFIVPTAHRVAAMNGCHRDAGHQGQQQMLYLLQDQF